MHEVKIIEFSEVKYIYNSYACVRNKFIFYNVNANESFDNNLVTDMQNIKLLFLIFYIMLS